MEIQTESSLTMCVSSDISSVFKGLAMPFGSVCHVLLMGLFGTWVVVTIIVGVFKASALLLCVCSRQVYLAVCPGPTSIHTEN